MQIAFQLRFSSLEVLFLSLLFFGSQNTRVPQSQTFGQTYLCVFQLRFSWQKRGAHPLFVTCVYVVTTRVMAPGVSVAVR